MRGSACPRGSRSPSQVTPVPTKEVHELVSDARTTQPRHAAQATPTSDEPAMRTPARREDLTADVVVVGAGPAGASAAYHMARLGLDVLLLEKNELGRDKVCGDGLTPSAVSELALMGVDTTGWQHNEGLRVIGGGHMLHVPWPERPSLPSYGMARRRSQLDRTSPSTPPLPARASSPA